MANEINSNELVKYFLDNKILVSLVKILLVIIAIKLILSISQRILKKIFNSKRYNEIKNISKIETVSKAIYSIIRIFVIFIGITIILGVFGINTKTLIATAGIGGIAIALGAQSLIQDFIVGALIIIDDKMRVGEWVKVAGIEGTVEWLDFRITKIRDFNGSIHIIPNSQISTVENFNRGYQLADASFKLPNEVSLKEAKEIVEVVSEKLLKSDKLKNSFKEKFTFFEIKDFTDFTYMVRMIAKVKEGDQWMASRYARELVKEELENRNIKIRLVENSNGKEI